MNYLIASTPRSGTKYTANILDSLGLNCGHERLINNRRTKFNLTRFGGESSWMSVPHLNELPKETVILHQLRNPIDVLNSSLVNGGGRFRKYPYIKEFGYHKIAFDNTSREGWVESGGKSAAIRNEQNWFCQWHNKIFDWCKNNEVKSILYKVEDLDADLLKAIIEMISPPQELKEQALDRIDSTLMEVSIKTNTNNNRGELGWQDTTIEFMEYANELGYL